MPDGAPSSTWGRCPTCGRLVTLPPAALTRRVACPVCRHEARGADFAGVDAPVPVIVLPEGLDSDEPRTHLLLTADDVLEEAHEDGAESAASDRARTRLMHAPLTAGAGRAADLASRAPLRANGPSSRLLQLSERLEEALHGRWLAALAVIAASVGGVAPILDYVATDRRSTLHAFTFVSVFAGLGTLLIARARALGGDDGRWDWGTAVSRIRAYATLSFESLQSIGESPRHLRYLLLGQALGAVGIAALSWAGLLAGWRVAFASAAPPTSLPFVSGLLVAGALGLVWHAAESSPPLRFSLEESGNALAAAAELPAIIDLMEPLPERVVTGSTLLHETLIALSEYGSRAWPDEAIYRAALARHLERRLPRFRIERERWIGRSRAEGVLDLVVDGVVVIAVKRGFHEASAERAVAQMNAYARVWSNKPLMLALFEVPRAALAGGASAAALAELHQRAAVLTARMPGAEAGAHSASMR